MMIMMLMIDDDDDMMLMIMVMIMNTKMAIMKTIISLRITINGVARGTN